METVDSGVGTGIPPAEPEREVMSMILSKAERDKLPAGCKFIKDIYLRMAASHDAADVRIVDLEQEVQHGLHVLAIANQRDVGMRMDYDARIARLTEELECWQKSHRKLYKFVEWVSEPEDDCIECGRDLAECQACMQGKATALLAKFSNGGG